MTCGRQRGCRVEVRVRGRAVSALDAASVEESPATEDQQYHEDDEESIRVHVVSCLTSRAARRRSVVVPDSSLAQNERDVCPFLNT
jgi:hypothetical protein